eukprot:CAMPEP_0202350340 /NCGR_PEP_ID=MMETSP1126-20121109/7453_1 /ASSEMBLY_ACC=CAM_ASM_000457 /TAXON_ID=3047 /ORGANISM="Dunaliella tertiolecta, Strain CCMP1320" /LENGTH=516 /DNA_ID=CAMNT_0048942295 /DNA_START=80 /DNA_END=1630 /DNA_ORIENTATION=+
MNDEREKEKVKTMTDTLSNWDIFASRKKKPQPQDGEVQAAEKTGPPAYENTTANKEMEIYSIHGEQAARRRAIGELIFFAGVNDLARCRQLASVWGIQVSDPMVMDYDKRTPLHIAAVEGAYSVVQWLVKDEKVPVNPLDRHGRTPLEEAASHDHKEVVMLLISAGGAIYEGDKLVPLDASKLRGAVPTRTRDVGWVDEWEVSPKELKFVSKIGSGEFGDVFKAKWHGSFVAAKLLKRSDEIALGDFRTEIAILRKIHHPNMNQFLGACTKQRPYVVLTELMACSLADAFHWTMITMNRRRQVEVALDFARGMAYLHSRRQPIAHRDLKPANLMFSGNLHADVEQLILDSGVVKVCDFGLSKTLMANDKLKPLQRTDTSAEQFTDTYKLTGETGSYRYMAPEVFRHEPYNLKVDVYSFAIICFQLFEQVAPYATMDPLQAARCAACEDLRPTFPKVSGGLTEVHQKLRTLVEECWDKDPEKRPSFVKIVERLEGVLQLLPMHIHTFTKDQECCTVS